METDILYQVDIPLNSTIRMNTGWCALDDATLHDYVEHMAFIFEIDGISYLDLSGIEYSFILDSEDASITYPCIFMGVTLSGCKIGEKHKIVICFSVLMFFDSWDT